jgi:hypothetical protein
MDGVNKSWSNTMEGQQNPEFWKGKARGRGTPHSALRFHIREKQVLLIVKSTHPAVPVAKFASGEPYPFNAACAGSVSPNPRSIAFMIPSWTPDLLCQASTPTPRLIFEISASFQNAKGMLLFRLIRPKSSGTFKSVWERRSRTR